jgi:phage terminase small subunit
MSPMPRKEIEQHKLEGTKPHYIDPASDVPAGRPKFPKNFTPEMKQTFKKICRLLEKRKTVTPGDAELIRIFCIALARQNRALAHINAEGEITTYIRLDNNGQPHDVVKENLWLKVCTDA